MNAEVSPATSTSVNRVKSLDFAVVLLCIVLIPSAVAQSFLGLDEKDTFALFAPLVLFATLLSNHFRVHSPIPSLVLTLVFIGTIASVLAMSISQLLMAVALAVAVVVGQQVFSTLIKPKVLRVVSWFALILLLGGIVGIVYSAIGGQPLIEIQVGYRKTYLYLTTFSFAVIGNIIRPSGIFDEPGALAMFVAIVTMFNDALQQNRKLNRALVLLVVFTGTLSGLAIAIWYMLASNDLKNRRKQGIIFVSSIAAVFLFVSFVAPNNPITSPLDTFYSERLRIEDGRLAGDNRSNQVESFFRLVDREMLLKGAKSSIAEYDSDDMSSNPFSITFGYGLAISLPYFALMLWLAGTTLQQGFRNSYTSLGMLFLLLQRPYLYHMSWSILIAATMWLVYHLAQKRRAGGNLVR